jgi:nicotinamidase-related amidase
VTAKAASSPPRTEKGPLARPGLGTGGAGDKSSAALLLIDVINHFEFPDGDRLLRCALPIAPKLARLKARARQARIPTIYVNDNFGQWRSDARKLIEYCVRTSTPGREFVGRLRPDEEDYFLLKPMHSAFFQTPLETLLRQLGTSTLILCGIATNSCVACTAHDANMREFQVYVPPDCCAARTPREHRQAIEHIRGITNVRLINSTSLRL